MRHHNFVRGVELFGGLFQIEKCKRTTRFNANLQMSDWTYQQSKLQNLRFHYDFVYKYCDLSMVQFMYTDTDSMDYAFAGDGTIESCVRPECRDAFEADKPMFLETDEASRGTPGLYKIESEASKTIAISPKCVQHTLIGKKLGSIKSSTKGIARNDPIRTDAAVWKGILEGGCDVKANVRGMRLSQGFDDPSQKGYYAYYEGVKTALSGRYDKKLLLADKAGSLLWCAPRKRSKLAPIIHWDSEKTVADNLAREHRSKRWTESLTAPAAPIALRTLPPRTAVPARELSDEEYFRAAQAEFECDFDEQMAIQSAMESEMDAEEAEFLAMQAEFE